MFAAEDRAGDFLAMIRTSRLRGWVCQSKKYSEWKVDVGDTKKDRLARHDAAKLPAAEKTCADIIVHMKNVQEVIDAISVTIRDEIDRDLVQSIQETLDLIRKA